LLTIGTLIPYYNPTTPYSPKGDQPSAIDRLVQGFNCRKRYQALFGATGKGKTFTIANVIAQTGCCFGEQQNSYGTAL